MVLIMHICFRTDDDDDDTIIVIVAAVVAAVVFAAAVLVTLVVIGLVVQRKKKRKSGHGKERGRQWLSQNHSQMHGKTHLHIGLLRSNETECVFFHLQ